MKHIFQIFLFVITLFGVNGALYAKPSMSQKAKLYAVVIGIGDYTGTIEGTFTIVKQSLDSEAIAISTPIGVSYTGKNETSFVTIKQELQTLKLGRDYSVSYKNCKKVVYDEQGKILAHGKSKMLVLSSMQSIEDGMKSIGYEKELPAKFEQP